MGAVKILSERYYRQKAELWISRKPALDAALKAASTAKEASSAQFLQHFRHRMQHTAAAQAHYGDRRHRQLRRRSFIKRQQAYSAICKTISGGSSDTVVAYGDAARGTLAHLQCHCGGSLGTAVRHHAIQQTNQFVLELASITLQRPNESSLVSQLAQVQHALPLRLANWGCPTSQQIEALLVQGI
ncbi:TPA: hypothetical protein ACH3X1_004512 [Trebouxia sp. C0004]